MYAYHVHDSRNSRFLLDSTGCSDCYGCFGLQGASYHIYNTPYTESQYKQKLVERQSSSISEQKRMFREFYTGKYLKNPLPNTGSENTTESENVIESKNVSFSRHIR